MMARLSCLPLVRQVYLINRVYCDPNQRDFIIVREPCATMESNFAVTDVNGNVEFQVKDTFFSILRRRVLLNAAGRPIVSLRRKTLTKHRRRKVFRGDSSDSKDLLFSAKPSSLTRLDVFLAKNTEENDCDFKVVGSWSDRSCAIYACDSSTIIAQETPSKTDDSKIKSTDDSKLDSIP